MRRPALLEVDVGEAPNAGGEPPQRAPADQLRRALERGFLRHVSRTARYGSSRARCAPRAPPPRRPASTAPRQASSMKALGGVFDAANLSPGLAFIS
jgi:hypothetical protein